MKHFSLICILLFAAVGGARADLVALPTLAPGATILNVDDTVEHNGINPLGGLLRDTGLQPFAFSGSGIITSGTSREVVYREASGTLDFFLAVDITGGSLSSLSTLATGNFAGFSTRAGTVSPVALLFGAPGSVQPTNVSRTPGGDTVVFNFLQPLTAGQNSFVMAISTDAEFVAPSNYGLIGAGGGTITMPGWQPANVITPEPAAVTWLLLGMSGALTMVLSRRNRA